MKYANWQRLIIFLGNCGTRRPQENNFTFGSKRGILLQQRLLALLINQGIPCWYVAWWNFTFKRTS